jgi:hypothetical protein
MAGILLALFYVVIALMGTLCAVQVCKGFG